MRFVFNLFNHRPEGQRSLEDPVMIMSHQMRALGHRVDCWPLSPGDGDPIELMKAPTQFVTDGVNVVVEGFSEWSIDRMAQARAQGARFLIVATEEPTDKGFNHGWDPAMRRRQELFPRAAALCDGILHLVPGEGVTRWYAQHAPAAYADLGHAPGLMRVTREEPTFDFGFYGALSPRRQKVLKKLSKALGKNILDAVSLCVDFRTQEERDAKMRRAKVILQVRKQESMGLVSSSRCATALSLGRPVVAEPHELSKPWDEIVTFAKTEDGFVAAAIMARATWRGTHAAQLARFAEKMSPQRCVGDALAAVGL